MSPEQEKESFLIEFEDSTAVSLLFLTILTTFKFYSTQTYTSANQILFTPVLCVRKIKHDKKKGGFEVNFVMMDLVNGNQDALSTLPSNCWKVYRCWISADLSFTPCTGIYCL